MDKYEVLWNYTGDCANIFLNGKLWGTAQTLKDAAQRIEWAKESDFQDESADYPRISQSEEAKWDSVNWQD